jgi:hypothetical protein
LALAQCEQGSVGFCVLDSGIYAMRKAALNIFGGRELEARHNSFSSINLVAVRYSPA